MEEAVARCKDKAFVSKPSQDFLRRVVQTSGVSDATAQPEGAQLLRGLLERKRLAPVGVPGSPHGVTRRPDRRLGICS